MLLDRYQTAIVMCRPPYRHALPANDGNRSGRDQGERIETNDWHRGRRLLPRTFPSARIWKQINGKTVLDTVLWGDRIADPGRPMPWPISKIT